MPRTKPAIGLVPLMLSLGTAAEDDDELTARILDATERLLAAFGLHRWSVDDVADRARVGRTSVYRKFATRDALVHGVLARELRRTLAAVEAAAAGSASLEDQIVEGAVVAFARLRDSVVADLLRSDPQTFLPFLTTDAAPLIDVARDLLAARLRDLDASLDLQQAAELAEIAARV
ncbi:MAG: TetR/AcrR family transcriptional regulator, partial [Acidimicrobiales bacterium]